MPLNAIRVMLVEDHALVRAGVRSLLGDDPGIRIVGEADNAATAVHALENGMAPNVDVVLLDLTLRDSSGWDVLSRLRDRFGARPAVLIVSAHRDDDYAIQALRRGADGFLSKEASTEHLARAIRRVAAGMRYVSPELGDRLSRDVVDGKSVSNPHESLSEREFQVFLRISRGVSLRDIAVELGVSPKTVTTWRSRILHKLDLRNNADIVRYALQVGLS
jgi:DNA-binding NarL/FixJ family response regulator